MYPFFPSMGWPFIVQVFSDLVNSMHPNWIVHEFVDLESCAYSLIPPVLLSEE